MEDKEVVQQNLENKEVQETKAPKKKKGLWLKIVGIVLLVIVLLFAGVLFFIDNILETGIRTGGGLIMKTKVEVDSVRLKILRGTLDIKNLRVENPEGSTNRYAFELPAFHIGLEIGSLTTDKIIINSIEITGMRVDYEPRLRGGSNIQILLDNMQDPKKKPAADAQQGATTEEKAEAEKAASKQVVIKDLVVNGGEIDVTLLGQTATIPMPPVHMTGIGESQAVTMIEAVTMFMKELVVSVVKASNQVVDSLGSKLKSAGSDLGTTAGSVIDEVKGLITGKKDEAKK